MTEFTGKLVGGRALYIPLPHAIHNVKPVGICQIPVNGDGDLCLEPTYSEEARRQHAASCAEKHASAIHAFRKRQHPDIMRPWDPELEAYVSANKQALLTGEKAFPRG